MKKVFILALTAIFFLSFDSWGRRETNRKMIRISKDEPNKNFSTPSLKRFIADDNNKGASVVVREARPFRDAENAGIDLAALIESGLMEKEFNPRDRKLFENAVDKLKDGSDYVEIRKVTKTDLIFEITQFKRERWDVEDWYYENAPAKTYKFMSHPKKAPKGQPKEKPQELTYAITGYSIEIKVILLADNLIAGTFRYYLKPCAKGCEVTQDNNDKLRYKDLADKNLTANIEDKSQRRKDSEEEFSDRILDWITEIVIPKMFEEMENGVPEKKQKQQVRVQQPPPENQPSQQESQQPKRGRQNNETKKPVAKSDENNTDLQDSNEDGNTKQVSRTPRTPPRIPRPFPSRK